MYFSGLGTRKITLHSQWPHFKEKDTPGSPPCLRWGGGGWNLMTDSHLSTIKNTSISNSDIFITFAMFIPTAEPKEKITV